MESQGEFKAYQFGDPLEKISMTESLDTAISASLIALKPPS